MQVDTRLKVETPSEEQWLARTAPQCELAWRHDTPISNGPSNVAED